MLRVQSTTNATNATATNQRPNTLAKKLNTCAPVYLGCKDVQTP